MNDLHIATDEDAIEKPQRSHLKCAEVVRLETMTTLDIPPDLVLDGAKKADLSAVMVIGEEADGTFYFASNKSDGADALWLLEKAKYKLLRIGGIIEE